MKKVICHKLLIADFCENKESSYKTWRLGMHYHHLRSHFSHFSLFSKQYKAFIIIFITINQIPLKNRITETMRIQNSNICWRELKSDIVLYSLLFPFNLKLNRKHFYTIQSDSYNAISKTDSQNRWKWESQIHSKINLHVC